MIHVQVDPATREAEAGESLEPRRQMLQWAKMRHFTPASATRARLCPPQKKKERKKKKKIFIFSSLDNKYVFTVIHLQSIEKKKKVKTNDPKTKNSHSS